MSSIHFNLGRKTRYLFCILVVFVTLFFIYFIGETAFGIKRTIFFGQKLYASVVNNKPEEFSQDYQALVKNFNNVKNKFLFIDRLSGGLVDKRFQFKKYFVLADELVPLFPKLAAEGTKKTYFVLLQNNFELRPSGGFMGSYAKVKFEDGSMGSVTVQDIYVPDGQVVGHIDPPKPIQEAFKQGWWRLRDANWDPDFPTASKIIEWFFQKGKEEEADGLIAVNLFTAQKMLGILGPLSLPDYQQTITKDNFYQIIQSYSETDFFLGSTQKRDILAAVGWAFLEKVKDLSWKEIYELVPIVYRDLEENQILLFFKDEAVEKTIRSLGWDGSLAKYQSSNPEQLDDYLYLVETNLGANKANCCIEREVRQEIDLTQEGMIKGKIKIDYQYQSGLTRQIIPISPGHDYINFLRLYLPKGAEILKVNVDGVEGLPLVRMSWGELKQAEFYQEEKADFGLSGFGFFLKVLPISQSTVEVEYQRKIPEFSGKQSWYHLSLQKQPGIEKFFYQLEVKSENKLGQWEKEITKDEEIKLFLYN